MRRLAWGSGQHPSDGSTVTARNITYNGSLAAGASTTFGVLGQWLATNVPPALSCAATT
ncbi:cellulose binding domain-containing protein [Actinoplanes sp. ATCC 53533]|uniref:cellulose binding domain-containing protein n=1 Tax=Actinoplanes sp. ATCC 53533 TaxID=1288362 RepID=UPI0018F51DCA|nr:cellulose binding domain-containing protein [Actinoplanes sp. ATCC 53533]